MQSIGPSNSAANTITACNSLRPRTKSVGMLIALQSRKLEAHSNPTGSFRCNFIHGNP
ncbi:hypothetical protein CA51_32410 [Rosistilla oblonga]|nr:hypothetical protein CA51_32410 [Rosistilla oblonga]